MAISLPSESFPDIPAPQCLYKWKTIDPYYEVQILRSDQDVIMQLYNRSQNMLIHSQFVHPFISDFRQCVQKWTREDLEVRLFQGSNSGTSGCVVVDLDAKQLYLFNTHDFTTQQLDDIKQSVRPVLFMEEDQLRLAFESDELFEEEWEKGEGYSDIGIIRLDKNGAETELVRLEKNIGLQGREDIRVIRKKEGSREALICELFDQVTKRQRTIRLNEQRPDEPMEERIQDVLYGGLPSLNYSANGWVESVSFVPEPPDRILFAEGENLSALSNAQIEATIVGYLKMQDLQGSEVNCYDTKKLFVEKTISETLIGRKPVIHIRLQRHCLVSTFKPIRSFIEALFDIGDAKSYKGSLKTTAMADLILRNSEITEAGKQDAWEAFHKAFIRCGTIDITVACDRTFGTLKCDDNTWTMGAANFGRGVRSVPRKISHCIRGREKDSPLEQEFPYVRRGMVYIQVLEEPN
ncbi:MAG: hypothetical protein KGJ02_07135 [Verrucomicrobiota bacterium]|nr:hypothetical protein [Verrucomicrobiota bacterium]